MHKAHRWNDRFQIIRGRQFFNHEMQLTFPDQEKAEYATFYWTVFGPSVHHQGLGLIPNDFNVSQALNRLTSCREAHRVGYCENLFENQRIEVYTPTVQHIYAWFRYIYSDSLEDYRGRIEELEDHYMDAHKMKKLRIQAFNELVYYGTLTDPCYVDQIQASFKIEICKPGKYGRLYANLGIHSSLQGATLTSMLKNVLAENELNVYGGTIVFVKSPNIPKLREVFHHLIDPPGRFYAVVFSDDSCLSVRVGNKVFRYNLDISSCDLSHGAEMFANFIRIMPAWLQEEVTLLVEQCRQKVVIRSKVNPKNKVVLLPREPFLPSGSVLTTVFNTVNVMVVIAYIMEGEFKGEETIKKRSEDMGYIMTVVDATEKVELLQFLKYSPTLDINGVYQPLLNLGVILRASGRCVRDLPGSGDLTLRAKQFQAALLQGTYPYVSFPFLDSMKEKVDCVIPKSFWNHPTLVELQLKVEDDRKELLYFYDEDVFKRYSLSDYEIELMETEIANLEVHEIAGNSAVDKIMALDYSYQGIF